MDTFVTEKSKDYSLLDNRTGEILEYSKTRKVPMENFVMVFLSSHTDLLSLKGAQLKLLVCCWIHSSFNNNTCKEGNLLHNDAVFKDNCRKDGLNISDGVIDNTICQLNKKGFLIKKCRGTYLLNPDYFFKGTLSDRSKLQYTLKVEPGEQDLQESIDKMNEAIASQS